MEKDIRLPEYDHSILSIITSILKYYNVETKYKSLDVLDKKLYSKEYRNVVFLILDGMGEYIYTPILPNGFFKNHEVDVVTSVYPSTTTAAITTYYSGKPPIETGWIAWSQYFKEYGRAVDMLSHKESYLREDLSSVRMNVFKELVNYKTVFQQIEEMGTKAYEVMPGYSDRRAKRNMRADDIDDCIMCIEDLCTMPDRKFIMAYCDKPDATLHKYGTTSEEVKEFLTETEQKVEKMCQNLPEDTLLIISADHGHKDISEGYSLLDHPELMECLYMPVSFESRLVNFFVKPDMKEQFKERFEDVFGEDFWLLSKEEVLEKNLLGYGNKHVKIDDFLGDFLALATSDKLITIETYLAEGKPLKKSTHCGITKAEMEVPVIIVG